MSASVNLRSLDQDNALTGNPDHVLQVLRKQRYLYMIGLWLAVAAYCWLGAKNLTLPGLHYDEVIQVPASVHLLKGDSNSTHKYFESIKIAGRAFPVMTMPYMGSLETYLYAFIFSILGINVEAFRLINIFLAVLALLLTSHFAKTFFGPLEAVVGTWLLATDPSFILLSRMDWGPFLLSMIFRLGALVCFWHWWKSGGKMFPLCLAGAAMGLGIYDKTNFLWFVVAMLVFGTIAWLISKERPKVNFSAFLMALVVGITTSLPLWIYNLTHHWETFRMAVLPGQTISLVKLLEQVPTRTEVLLAMLNSEIFSSEILQGLAPVHWGIVGTLMLWLSVIALLVLLFVGCLTRCWKLLLLPMLTLLIIGQIYLTPRPVWVHHWIGIYPFTHVAVGVMAKRLWISLKINGLWKKIALCGGALVIFVALCFNVMTMLGYQRMMVENGGKGYWSDAIYGLAETLKGQYAGRQIHLMDWGIGNQLVLLSSGDLRLRETFWSYTGSSQPDNELLTFVRDPANVFLLHAPETTAFPTARDAFYEAVHQAGGTVRTERKFYDRRNGEIFSLIELAP